ncbi:MAG: hypothetical protein CVU08_07275 [Bacteroidetes bacterium HGW-Bacteroidetes-3]|nr:MAG: hypothetical protein CVU08_07275 [Bacteroidetes bacterium HGW-Bacteroidetes-3]
MITKNYKSIFSYLAALTAALFVVSCDQEDNTGFGTLVPTSPTLTVTTSVSNKSLIEDDSVYEFTATLSTPQLVDVKLFVTQIAGDAINGDDYTVDGSLVIPAGATSAKGKVKILSDDLIEATETVKLQIGDNLTANASITPVTMEFTILNYTEGDLAIDLSWALGSVTTDNSGNAISPTAFADLRLLVSSTPDNSGDIGEADGGSFETFVMDSSTPNGEYYLVADFYDVNSEIVRDLNLNTTFNQAGLINDLSYDFPAALNSGNSCSTVYYVLAKIVKSGDSYTITALGEKSPVTAAPFIGTATAVVDEWADYGAGDQTELLPVLGDPFSFIIDTPDFMTWIANNDTAFMVVTIDPATGNVTVKANEYFDYGQPGGGGDEFGTGFVNACTGEINLSITYDLAAWGLYPNNALILQSDNF